MRTQIISHILSEIRLKLREDVANDLRPIVIKKNSSQILKKSINDRLNPFSENLKKEVLYHICNGQSAQPEADNFLLQVMQLGDE